ncbi:MAG TPA: tyrosine phosphatase family protein [Afifellaceae bacterium]|nr:tyrosine phosphatase family protein [Afifellaceae bacterium]
MPAVYVCPLSRLRETVERSGASHVVTLINPGTPVARPPSVPEDRHLFIGVNDITDPIDGMILPDHDHLDTYLDFLRDWDRKRPMVIHCWAGVSRSTAGAFTALCLFRPDLPETLIAERLRARSPEATPNARLVALADARLGREGRMIEAVRRIGRGADAFEGTVFSMAIDE